MIAMDLENTMALILAVLITAYLFYVLIRAEEL